MSLILDALRKSEAERRRGRMPDLHAELPPIVHATAQRKRAWPWWFVGLAVAVAAAALAWSQWASRSPSVSAPAFDGAGQAVAAVAASARPASPSPTPAPALNAPASEPAATAKRMHATEPAAVPDAPSTAATDAPAPVIDIPAPTSASPAPAARYEPAIANAAMPAPPAPLPAPETTAPLPVPPNASGAVRLADLSPGEREQLPTLKISMHMWGPTPAQRFAIIDGARVGQGDRVGEAVVEEILSDGVVLSWHGRRLSLPLR
jgi:general secretion pathway protein B